MKLLNSYLKSRLAGHLEYESWRPEEKLKYLTYLPDGVVTVLDVGCGQGELLWLLKSNGFEVEGCDTDEICIKKAKSITQNVKYADVEKLSQYYAADSFDMLTCLHVLEHCRSPYMALEELKIVSKRYVLIAVPNARCIIQNERKTHLYSWTWNVLKNILENVGFKKVFLSEDYVNIFPNILKIAPILNRILVKAFWGPMELIALVRK